MLLLLCRDKPKLISDGEKMALLYNIACCHSQMQDARNGLVALAGAAAVEGHTTIWTCHQAVNSSSSSSRASAQLNSCIKQL
jgi:hypothetical protein